MEKNVIVADENGRIYGATYPKRAKGLVKHGRARFIDENRICLACSPHKREGNNMKNAEIDVKTAVKSAVSSETENVEEMKEQTQAPNEAITMKSILARIDKIISDTDHLRNALRALDEYNPLPVGDDSYAPGDLAGQAKAQALGDVVKCRETTNQQLLRFLEKMYDDIKPKELSPDMLKLKQLADILSIYPPDAALDIIRRSAQQMFVHAGAEIVH